MISTHIDNIKLGLYDNIKLGLYKYFGFGDRKNQNTLISLETRAVTINRFESIQVANRLIDSKLLNRLTETIHYFYLFNCIVARKCQQIDFYQT